MVQFTLTPDDHQRISDAVARAETLSDAEIVTVIAARSDAYHDVGLHYAVAGVFVLLACVAGAPGYWHDLATGILGGWDHQLSAREAMSILLCAGIILFLAIRYALAFMPLRMALTPAATKSRRVRRAAIHLFRATVEGRTRAKTGVLLYLSLAEHRAEIVADAAITATVAPEEWGAAMASLIHHVRAGAAGDGMVAAIGCIEAILARAAPRSSDDTDELPNRLIEL